MFVSNCRRRLSSWESVLVDLNKLICHEKGLVGTKYDVVYTLACDHHFIADTSLAWNICVLLSDVIGKRLSKSRYWK